jgi:hypothetical protein
MSKMPKIRGYERKKKREITGIEEAVGNEAAVSGSCIFRSCARGSWEGVIAIVGGVVVFADGHPARMSEVIGCKLRTKVNATPVSC